MRLLVLGGTSFVGRAIVEEALGRGHEVTLFGRGRTGPDLFETVERRIGDRSCGDYAALATGSWDAVVDVSAYIPRHVGEAADALADRCARYLLISTISVYDHRAAGAMDEDTPRLPAERTTEVVTGDTYGPLKVACEDEIESRLGARATIVRPGVVAGPHDTTDRFTYWARRAARGGRVGLSGRRDQPVQVVDSRDLARLVTTLVDDDVAGIYDAVGPDHPIAMAGLIETCARAAGSSVEVVEVTPDPGIPPTPLVVADPTDDGVYRRAGLRARAVGLTATPLDRTASDVLAWDIERGRPPLASGPTAEQEAALLG